MNFMKNLRASDTIEEPMSPSTDVAYSAVGFVPAAESLVNVDRMHLYKNETDGASSSFGPY